MVSARTLTRAAVVALLTVAPAVWYACSDRAADSPAGPAVGPSPQRALPDLRVALAAQRRHTPALLDVPGVVGTAVGLQDGKPAVLVLLERSGVGGLPRTLDGVPVMLKVTGRIMALSDPKQRQRPAPVGYSVGHPQVTAGTIGARVRDALGRVYILSNNHVLAASNNAQLGDPAYQPGVFDGGTAADQIATLSDFQPITFTTSASNTVDGAIALSSATLLDNATPSDDGYGMPNATIFGDANGDGRFDDRNDLLGVAVQKYGRTTKLTHGTITAVNATVTVCYAVSGTLCTKPARFVDQLIISPSGFSNGGDSGSLIVTDDVSLNPVGLLFAGSATVTIANRIDLVLLRFGVVIDGFEPPPPGPFTDLSITAINGPSAAVVGTTSGITVTVKNFGNQDVAAFDITLRDSTEQALAGIQSVSGLTAGATATVTLGWTPATLGDHDLVATHT
ncbi:MAG: CARDB domain-containing protein, partial [Gammaproteobacteria bacterium]